MKFADLIFDSINIPHVLSKTERLISVITKDKKETASLYTVNLGLQTSK